MAGGPLVAKKDIETMRSVILVTLLFTLCGQIVPKSALAGADSSQICAKAVHAAEIQHDAAGVQGRVPVAA